MIVHVSVSVKIFHVVLLAILCSPTFSIGYCNTMLWLRGSSVYKNVLSHVSNAYSCFNTVYPLIRQSILDNRCLDVYKEKEAELRLLATTV